MSMIRPETEMKDSGIEYVGAIPNDWDLVRLRAYFGERKNKNKDGNETNLLSLSYGRIIRKNIDKTDGLLPASFNTYNIVEKNDIIIRPTDLQNDKRSLRTGLVTEHGIITSAYIDLMPIGNVDSRFVHYLLHSYDILKVFYNMGSGVRQGLNYSEFSKLKVPMPLLSEQQAIADYLDKTCSKIDEIIAEAKASIDEYKELKQSVIFEVVTKGLDKNVEMKDSGVEWIGKIPATWDVLRIKDIGAARNGLTYSPNDQVDSGKGTLVLRSSNVQNGQIVFDDNVYVNKDIPDNLMLDEGDILICSRNGSRRLIGKNAIVPESGKYTFGAFMMVLKPFNDNKKYIHWILNSGVFGYYLPMFFTSTINQLTRENFRNMQIPYCMDANVQKDIVEYLDKKCELFDSLIAEKESLIKDLESYKKSLIYKVVTGKRRVV